MLHLPERHEPLDDAPWDAERAREAIRTIVADVEAHRREHGRWRVHPLDADGGEVPRSGFKSLNAGRGGAG